MKMKSMRLSASGGFLVVVSALLLISGCYKYEAPDDNGQRPDEESKPTIIAGFADSVWINSLHVTGLIRGADFSKPVKVELQYSFNKNYLYTGIHEKIEKTTSDSLVEFELTNLTHDLTYYYRLALHIGDSTYVSNVNSARTVNINTLDRPELETPVIVCRPKQLKVRVSAFTKYAGPLDAIEFGFCWGEMQNGIPNVNGNRMAVNGNFNDSIVGLIGGLSPTGSYYINAYCKTVAGLQYSQVAQLRMSNPYNIVRGSKFRGGIVVEIEPGNIHGIIMLDYDLPETTFGCKGLYTKTFEEEGKGRQNTELIVANCTDPSSAAAICDNLVANGFDDWYLPSYLDFYNKIALTGMANEVDNSKFYWTSTEIDANSAQAMRILGIRQTSHGNKGKLSMNAIRPFREF